MCTKIALLPCRSWLSNFGFPVTCLVLGCFNIKYPCPNIIEGGNCQCHGRYHGYGVLVVVLASSETSSFFLPLLYICAMKGIEDCLLPACCRLVLINDESLSLFWFLVFNRVLFDGFDLVPAAGGTGADVLQSFAQYSHLPQKWPHYPCLIWS